MGWDLGTPGREAQRTAATDPPDLRHMSARGRHKVAALQREVLWPEQKKDDVGVARGVGAALRRYFDNADMHMYTHFQLGEACLEVGRDASLGFVADGKNSAISLQGPMNFVTSTRLPHWDSGRPMESAAFAQASLHG